MIGLRPYQFTGAERLARESRMILADPVGYGKTRTALAAATLRGAHRVVVLCPPVVAGHWRHEWLELGCTFALGTVSYGRISTKTSITVGLNPPDVLIVDEFHFLKNTDSKRAKAVFGRGGLVHQVLSVGGAVYPVSGTPMPRNPAELYPAMVALWPDELARHNLATLSQWRNTFCVHRQGSFGARKVYAARNVVYLKSILYGKMIRRKAVDLPPLRLGVLTVTAQDLSTIPDLPPDVMDRLRRGQLPPLDDELIARHMHAVGDLKAPLVADIVGSELEADPQAKRVLFCHHHSVMDRLEADLRPYGVARVDGTTPETTRQRLRVEFAQSPLVRVFIGQSVACGTGMDGLQYGAHDVLLVEPEWNSDLNVQAIGRVARLGQKCPVQARLVSLEDTADEAVVAQYYRESKMRLQVVE